ncbi:hypothetical protein ABT368_31750 [Streptomyces althioticus]|uniref:Uncharacterized protein n=1 Tax=Streptomyces sp. FQ1 TaxID=319426 RepID=Q58IP0_9ACTN|nr:hypothetical protein [Streptomyces sp. DI166]AAX51343.1 unknown [Streptomyces sp. FQ1]MYS50910.1 hypothetical protein [Streptomyces sp. SID6013]WTB51646.1 hypothetical protein OG968_36000 [Streptomyces althioticus]SBT93991.1 hypothetical protein GA0115233_107625 [Streptomyces sp. DI166]
MPKPRPVSCVENGSQSPRRLGGAEAIVIIVVIAVSAALVAVAGMPLLVVLQLLAGAGLTAAVVVGLLTGATSRWMRAVLRALLAPAA